jgi:phosphoacetylglucosamine mutase
LLHPIGLRSGIFSSALARYCYPKSIGIVITASHNQAKDNGLKMIGPDGGMLHRELETIAENLVNEPDLETAYINLDQALKSYHEAEPGTQGLVFIGNDTRPSGLTIKALFKQGANATSPDVALFDFNLVTTPIIHHHVEHYNMQMIPPLDYAQTLSQEAFCTEMMDIYYKKIATNYKQILELTESNATKVENSLITDCSNGIGGVMLHRLLETYLPDAKKYIFTINTDIANVEILNKDCGAEFVQKEKKIPSNFHTTHETPKMTLNGKSPWGFSFDGDADRIVLFTYNPTPQDPTSKRFNLIDGDRLSVLYAKTVNHFLQALIPIFPDPVSVGVVYTAYGNGAATSYIRDSLKLITKCCPTGVKWSHPEALKFDIGIYFEANGHGTFVWKPTIGQRVDSAISKGQQEFSSEIWGDLNLFKTFLTLINQVFFFSKNIKIKANGDAVGNLFMIVSCLRILGLTLEDLLGLYEDFPSSTTKIFVKNKNAIKTTWDEQTVTTPNGSFFYIDFIRFTGRD